MPLGIISESELESELENLNLTKSQVKKVPFTNIEQIETVENPESIDLNHKIDKIKDLVPSNLGRGIGSTEIPESIRKVIAQEKLEGTKDHVLAEAFGVSPSSISAYKNGAVSTKTYNEPKAELSQFLRVAKQRISKRASKKLNLALSYITDEKLAECKAVELSSVARNLSNVMVNMEQTKDSAAQGNRAQFIFVAPQQKQVSQYEVVEVNS